MRRVIKGIATTLITVVILIIIIECCLRFAGLFYNKQLVTEKNINNGIFIVYCFGDSYTYGIGSENNKKGYPEQLQELCKKQWPSKNIKIVNFGIPGSNSTQVLKYFKHILFSSGYLKPNLVILMTGVNDWWNISYNNKALLYYKTNPFIVRCCMLLMHSKFVKLLAIYFIDNVINAKTNFYSEIAIANSEEFGARDRLGSKYLNIVRIVFEQNVIEFVNLARGQGIDIIFSQYPKGFVFDSILENISERQNISIVYNYEEFKECISSGQLDEYFSPKYSYSHPNNKGYAIMADKILKTLIKKSAQAGF